MGATLRAPALPRFERHIDAAKHISECLHMVAGIEVPVRGSGYDEAKEWIVREWGKPAWLKIEKQANRIAWARDGAVLR